MTGWILLATLLLLLVYLLTAPVWLEVDTTKGYARVRFHRLLVVTMTLAAEAVQMEVKLFGIKRKLTTGRTSDVPAEGPSEKAHRPAKQPPGRSRFAQLRLRKILAVLRTFRIRELVLHLDTGSQPLNGILYPLAEWLHSRTGHDVRISFTGGSKLIVRVKNNLLRMLWAYARG